MNLDDLDKEGYPAAAPGQPQLLSPAPAVATTVPAVPDPGAAPLDLAGIVELFSAAKTAIELTAYARDCSVPVWLDWMVKLSPKAVKVNGQLDIRAVFANLGPQRHQR